MKVISLLLILTLSSGIYSQKSKILIENKWEKSDTIKFEINEIIIKGINGDTSEFYNVEYSIIIEVLEVKEEYILTNWKYTNFQVNGEEDYNTIIMSCTKEKELKIKLDYLGKLLSIENIRDVQKQVYSNLSEYSELNIGKKLSRYNKWLNDYQEKELIEESTIDEIYQLLFFNGQTYKIGKKYIEFLDTYVKYNGQEDYIETIVKEQLNKNDKYLVVEYSEIVNDEELKHFYADALHGNKNPNRKVPMAKNEFIMSTIIDPINMAIMESTQTSVISNFTIGFETTKRIIKITE